MARLSSRLTASRKAGGRRPTDQLERRRITERTTRGRADAKVKGVRFGRKPKLTQHQKHEAIRRRDEDGETLHSIARRYNASATISRLAP